MWHSGLRRDVESAGNARGAAVGNVTGMATPDPTDGAGNPGGVGRACDADGALTEQERAILDFAGMRWKYAGARDAAIRDRFDMSATRYFQVLNALLDRPAAAAHAPVLVARLRRVRDARRRARSGDR